MFNNTSVASNSTTASTTTRNPEDILSIMVATDIHLGYEEADPIIGEDSFIAFEEILSLAVKHKVDMILLGGDLFHHNNPTQKSMNRCMALLRQYTMGDNPVYLEFLSSVDSLGDNLPRNLNYMDSNFNISIPVFSIHGNHDDPSGPGQFSSMDTLASAGLINYFGKWTNLDEVVIKPLLLRKGRTNLALYGLSHIKDDRLCRLYLQNKVKMLRPKEDTDSWFNIFVLHQNRVERGPKRYIPESMLPTFLDLVIWGHEHDCEIDLMENLERGFYVTQPGSSVPTSLSQGETKAKKVGILKIYEKSMRLKPVKLKTTRPFLWENMRLMDIPVTTNQREQKSEEIKRACAAKVEEMIQDARKLITGHPYQPRLPLIRLRCEYNEETQLFNLVKFGQLFYKRVANPSSEIIRLKRVAGAKVKKDQKVVVGDRGNIQNLLENEEIEESMRFLECVDSFIQNHFENRIGQQMLVLSMKGMANAVEDFIEKENTGAVDAIVESQMKRTMRELEKLDVDEETLPEQLARIRDERLARVEEAIPRPRNFFEQGTKDIFDRQDKQQSAAAKTPENSGSDTDEYEVDMEQAERSTEKAKPAREAKASKQMLALDSDEEFDEVAEVPTTRGRKTRARGRARGAVTAAPRARGRARGRATTTPSSSTRSSGGRGATMRSIDLKRQQLITSYSNSIVFDDSD